MVLGRNGGFKSVTYGATKFISRFADPRDTGLYDDAVVVVDDPARENYECPDCGAAPGAQCVNKKGQSCATHRKRSSGRSRWEIERTQEAERVAHEEARAAEQWKRDMATPPAVGANIEIKRWRPVEPRHGNGFPISPNVSLLSELMPTVRLMALLRAALECLWRATTAAQSLLRVPIRLRRLPPVTSRKRSAPVKTTDPGQGIATRRIDIAQQLPSMSSR